MGERAHIVFDDSLADLARRFNVKSGVRAHKIPSTLHNEFLQLYRRSARMHDRLQATLEDGEHKLCMEEGQREFEFLLPSPDFLKSDLAELKQRLRAFDPYAVQQETDGNIRLKGEQIEGFFKVFAKDYDIVHGVFDMFRDTDYMKYIRFLRDRRHTPYAGPTSLSELTGVYFGLARAQKQQQAYLEKIGESLTPH